MTETDKTDKTDKLSARDRAVHDLSKVAEKLSSHRHKHRGFGEPIDVSMGAAFDAIASAVAQLKALPVDVKPVRSRGQRDLNLGGIYKVKETAQPRLRKILGLPDDSDGAAMVIVLDRLDGSEILVQTGDDRRLTLKASDLDGEVIAA